ncbi:UPF0454 protein C12orf49 homolog isoform X3 [Camelus ferus]|uniref:UPF0454 protein C12orf49 homolog isoform X3 n=1 Tax=Camelus ferus TaxID=419612 RepID=A0A8B8SCU1_CAMFR|nr:UPF0454 protein C12orf49 homolog isoform X3 [Camelus ferus]
MLLSEPEAFCMAGIFNHLLLLLTKHKAAAEGWEATEKMRARGSKTGTANLLPRDPHSASSHRSFELCEHLCFVSMYFVPPLARCVLRVYPCVKSKNQGSPGLDDSETSSSEDSPFIPTGSTQLLTWVAKHIKRKCKWSRDLRGELPRWNLGKQIQTTTKPFCHHQVGKNLKRLATSKC